MWTVEVEGLNLHRAWLVVVARCIFAACRPAGWATAAHQRLLRPAALCCAVLCCAGTLAGVVGVAVTGYILDAAGGASQLAGWWTAHLVASAILLAASMLFNVCAKGTRLFD
jgi:hypothetical protein